MQVELKGSMRGAANNIAHSHANAHITQVKQRVFNALVRADKKSKTERSCSWV